MTHIPRQLTLPEAIALYSDAVTEYQALANTRRVLLGSDNTTSMVTYTEQVKNGMFDENGAIRPREFFTHELKGRYKAHLKKTYVYDESKLFPTRTLFLGIAPIDVPVSDQAKAADLEKWAKNCSNSNHGESIRLNYEYAKCAAALQPEDKQAAARYAASLHTWQKHKQADIDTFTQTALAHDTSYDDYKHNHEYEYREAELSFPTREEWDKRLRDYHFAHSGLDANKDGTLTPSEAEGFARRVESALQLSHFSPPALQRQATDVINRASRFAPAGYDGTTTSLFGEEHITALQPLLPEGSRKQLTQNLRDALHNYNEAQYAKERYAFNVTLDKAEGIRELKRHLKTLPPDEYEAMLKLATDVGDIKPPVELGPEGAMPAVPLRIIKPPLRK